MGCRPRLENPGSTIDYCVHTLGTNQTSSLSISLLFLCGLAKKWGGGLLKFFFGVGWQKYVWGGCQKYRIGESPLNPHPQP